jgi:hypothetical protein
MDNYNPAMQVLRNEKDEHCIYRFTKSEIEDIRRQIRIEKGI